MTGPSPVSRAPGRRRDRPRNAAITARNAGSGAPGRIRMRPPERNTTSIAAVSRSGHGLRCSGVCGASSHCDTRTGTNSGTPGEPNRPSRTCRRQPWSRLGPMSCRPATPATRAPGSWLSATMPSFSDTLQRRRRSRPATISMLPPVTVLNSGLKALLREGIVGTSGARNKAGMAGRLRTARRRRSMYALSDRGDPRRSPHPNNARADRS